MKFAFVALLLLITVAPADAACRPLRNLFGRLAARRQSTVSTTVSTTATVQTTSAAPVKPVGTCYTVNGQTYCSR